MAEEYKRAFVELNEIIKRMSLNEKEKIPKVFLENLNNEMDKNYEFLIDDSKSILEQEFMVETKALLVELYERYLAPEEEKNKWKEYDRICLESIENVKKKKYNPDDIFKNETENDDRDNERVESNNLPIEIKEESIFSKFIQIIKRIFHIR